MSAGARCQRIVGGNPSHPSSFTLSGVLLAYVDEAYVKRTYWIAGLVCDEAILNPLAADLDEVVREASENYGVRATAELHGHDLLHGTGDWKPMHDMIRARIGVYGAAFEAIASYPVAIFIRGVDRRRLEKRYVRPEHPHSVCLAHLFERIDEYAERESEFVLAIADQVDRADDYREDLRAFREFGTGGYRSRRLARFVDTICFVPSSPSRLVQAVDMLAYLHCRMQSDAGRDERAVRENARLWARVRHRMRDVGCWVP